MRCKETERLGHWEEDHHGRRSVPAGWQGLGWEVCEEVLESSGTRGSDQESTDVAEEMGHRAVEPEDIMLTKAKFCEASLEPGSASAEFPQPLACPFEMSREGLGMTRPVVSIARIDAYLGEGLSNGLGVRKGKYWVTFSRVAEPGCQHRTPWVPN